VCWSLTLGFNLDSLPIEDVRRIVHLLGDVAIQSTDLNGKRRLLLEGLASLIDADFWLWVRFRDNEKDGLPIAFNHLTGGWRSEAQAMKFGEGTISPAAIPFNERLRVGAEVHRTRRRIDLFPDKEWFALDICKNFFEPADVGEFVHSAYPLGNRTRSVVSFLRALGRPSFEPREVCITHIITSEVEWLHRDGMDVPAAEHVNDLTLRQRQVLLYVLAGDSVKQVARKLSLSNHTVNDHLKQIYRRFHVGGRGELLAQFLAGGTAGGNDP
jgi:DNA-binding CsgD family transcriptional regulator